MSEMGTSGSSGESGVTATVKGQASELREKGALQVESQLDQRTTQAGQQARSLAEALRRSGSELQGGNGGGGVQRMTSGIADRLDSVGGYLERASGDELLRDAERFARQRPWVVAGSAALAGFAASRLLKASSEGRYERGMSTSTPTRHSASRRSGSTEPTAVGSGGAR